MPLLPGMSPSPVSSPRAGRNSTLSTAPLPPSESPTLHSRTEGNQVRERGREGESTSIDSAIFSPNMRPLASSWETAVSQSGPLNVSQAAEEMADRKKGSPAPPPRPPRPARGDLENYENKENEGSKVIGSKEVASVRGNRPMSMPLPRHQSPRHPPEGAISERPKSLSHSDRDAHAKRSISWSAAVESSKRPPRPRSSTSILTPSSSFNPSPSLSTSFDTREQSDSFNSLRGKREDRVEREGSVASFFRASDLATSHDFDGHVALPPLSEYALRTGVIIEGWLEKKSSVTGFWQKVRDATSAKNVCTRIEI